MDPEAPTQPFQRTSLMALGALGLSLMCPVPLSGFCGAVLGGIALRRIGTSGGRLSGGGPAKFAVVLGVIVTAMQMFVFFGVAQSWTFYRKQMLPVMERGAEAIQTLELDPQGEVWSELVFVDLDSARLSALRDSIGLSAGSEFEIRIGPGEMWRSFRTLARSSSVRPAAAGDESTSQAVPCTLVVDNREYFVWFFFNIGAMEDHRLLIDDVLVLVEEGRAVTLMPEGEAFELATEWLEWEVIPLDGGEPSS